MKIYSLTEAQVERLIEIGMDAHDNLEYVYAKLTPHDIFERIEKELLTIPVEFDDVSINGLDVQCRFFPANKIVGFTFCTGALKGVFIKE